jgi:hypothetical protein
MWLDLRDNKTLAVGMCSYKKHLDFVKHFDDTNW